jgi:hypothetical protein
MFEQELANGNNPLFIQSSGLPEDVKARLIEDGVIGAGFDVLDAYIHMV